MAESEVRTQMSATDSHRRAKAQMPSERMTLQYATGHQPIEAWITCGWLIALRNHIDGYRYIDLDRLLDVDRDVRRDGHSTVIHPEPLTLAELRQWLWDHGRPVTVRALEDWVYGQRILTAVIPGQRGRGGAARFDPVAALKIALDPRYAPKKQALTC